MRPITFILGLILGLGICLRFDNLPQKVYWYDEAFTSLRAAGYTEVEVVQHFAEPSVITAADLQQFQQPNPQRGLPDTLHSLAVEDTHHPPLYYSLAHFWMRSVGSSVTVMRALSAILSLLVFPCLYWLCWELFGAKEGWGAATGWMAIGIVAVSPFHLLYAQEARQYSLWAATTVLMTAALLRAIRRNTVLSWGVYALSTIAGLYTFLFTALVMIAHGIYVMTITNFRFNATLRRFLIASAVAVLVFLPWAWIVATNLEQAQAVTSWTTHQRPLLGLVTSWANILGELFYNRGTTIADRAFQVGIVGVIGVAFYMLCRHTPKSVWALVVALTAVPALTLMLPDVLLGGHRSAFPRYLTPTLIGIQIAVAYLFTLKAVQFTQQQFTQQQRQRLLLWRSIVVAVLVGGIISSIATVQASSASIKWLNDINLEVAPVINQTENPLIISDTATADLLSLSHLLDPDVHLLINPRCYTCHLDVSTEIDPDILQIPEGYSTVYLFHPRSSREWRQSLQAIEGYQLRPVSTGQDEALWRITSTSSEMARVENK
jgi:uncharacterized membrane protein